jgi:uncharacterized protein YjeT (DUF2065 family)
VIALALGLAALIGGLCLVAYLKTRAASSVVSSIVSTLDRSARRVGLFALVPGLAAMAWIIQRGVEPPAAFVVGAAIAIGVFAMSLAILKMEGLLVERQSEAVARNAAGGAPPSTSRGRVVAITIGMAFVGAGFVALRAVS